MTGSDLQSDGASRESPLASYAVADHASRGRVHLETPPVNVSPFEFDRGRILNSMAFRRLMHKTQVFVTESGDHFRTRLTHTLEVAIQAERLARLLGLNDRLAGAIGLAHDLGHPPFGHAGEQALAALMGGHGGFEHNLQSLRVVDYLEHPYPAFRGLNLTFELRESLLKHHTEYDRPETGAASDAVTRELADAGPCPPLEGQVANVADDIAYTLHDIEDAIGECGLTEQALDKCQIWREAAESVRECHSGKLLFAIRRPILDQLAERLIEDAAAESHRRITKAGIVTPDDARSHAVELVAFSGGMCAGLNELQCLLADSVYRNDRVVEMDSQAKRLVRELFAAYLNNPDLLPERFRRRLDDPARPHKVICDYIAGMTDRFCRQEHHRLLGSTEGR